MKLIKLVAVLAVMGSVACGSRDWRPHQPSALSKTNANNANGVNSPSVLSGASLKVAVGQEEGKGTGTVSVVMSPSCEQFEVEITLKGQPSPVVAKDTHSTGVNSASAPHGAFDSRCVGVDGNCDRVVVSFTHNHGSESSHTDVVFQKNQFGNYSPVGYPESDEFLSGRNAECVAQPRDNTIPYNQD